MVKDIKMDNQQVSIQQCVMAEGLTSSKLPFINKYNIDFDKFMKTLPLGLTNQSEELQIARHTMKKVRNSLFNLYEELGLPKGFRIINQQGCENYAVNKNGIIINKRTREIISTRVDNKGYVRANITYINSEGTRIKYIRVHRAVALTFLTKENEFQTEVNHISGIKSDNSISNLEWCTSEYNMKHKKDTGLTSSLKGEKNPASKLTDNKVKELRIRHSKGESASYLAKELNMDISTICDVVNYTSWRHVE